jgi:hypothetical protein
MVGLGSHDKGRAHTGDMGIGRKPKTCHTFLTVVDALFHFLPLVKLLKVARRNVMQC